MNTLFAFLLLAFLSSPVNASTDYIKKVAFVGTTAEDTRSECNAVEKTIRSKMNANELRILKSEKNLINIKGVYSQELWCPSEGACLEAHLCNLHFISFTPVLGFEEVKSLTKKHLKTRNNAQNACLNDVNSTLEADEAIVYARTSVRNKPLRGGHQCNVIGVRVVPMLTN